MITGCTDSGETILMLCFEGKPLSSLSLFHINMLPFQEWTSDSGAVSSVAFSEAPWHDETASVKGDHKVSGILYKFFLHQHDYLVLGCFAYDPQCLQDTLVMGDLQCVQALWMPNTTLEGEKEST